MADYTGILREKVPCNICSATQYTQYDSQNGWYIVKCTSCGHYYTNPSPLLSELPKIYDAEYFNDKTFTGNISVSKQDEETLRPKVSLGRMSEIEHFFNTRGSALEIGPARGDIMYGLKHRGWDVDGVEISEEAATFGKTHWGLNIFCGTFDAFNTNKKYDIIYMYQVMEHVPDPVEVIKKSFELLKTGGLLLVEVPNLECVEMRFNAKRKAQNYQLPRHLSHFKPQILKTVFEKNGFEVVRLHREADELILRAVRFIHNMKQNGKAHQQDFATKDKGQNTNLTTLPMLRISDNFKVRLIDRTSRFLPGWRFTIVGRKK